NKDARKEWNFKNINGYAVNGAVHYANALLQFTNYPDIIAIGMTGWRDDDTGELHHEIGVWYVSKNNLGAGQKVGEFTDLSFLADKNVDGFLNKIKLLNLPPEELEKIKASKEEEIDTRLSRLNNDIYQNEKGLGESDRVYLVVATVIATLGIPGKLAPLDKKELTSSTEEDLRDGDIIFRKIRNFLRLKAVPETKREMILRSLQNTLWTENINKPVNGESQLKRVFVKVVD
ncbi:restriction endonuclease subunit M, partial [Escherichia coli]|nr:restriction endonuclease subunit M [Escherichia coli]